MKVAFNMNCVSTHQLPLAREMAALVGADNFTYVYEGESGQAYQRATVDSKVFKNVRIDSEEGRAQVENADIVLSGLRDIDLFERRAAKGLKTFYTSERWFKPIEIRVGGMGLGNGIPGWVRMVVPSYRKMVRRFVRWANTDLNARVLAIGPWAKKDFLRMGVRADKIIPWGYFVAPSESKSRVEVEERKSKSILQLGLGTSTRTLKVLWVGRDLAWKRADDIKRAVALANKNLATTLQLPLSSTTKPISFTKLTGVTPAEVRKAMREHDVYVLASNAEEGWGAALNEALEEGMSAIGTYEAGASAAMLSEERLYHAGDVKALARLLEAECRGELPSCAIGDWTAKSAAKHLIAYSMNYSTFQIQ